MDQSQPHLAPPGAGLPPLQQFLSKHFMLPAFCAFNSWGKAASIFRQEGDIILRLAQKLSSSELTKQVLVPPQWGIEDSSRFWSVAMVMEHLIIVGQRMENTIILLSQGQVPEGTASTAEVKPTGDLTGGKAIKSFSTFLDRFLATMKTKIENPHSSTKYPHPWFGPLTAHRWICLAALHQRIHRLQAQTIIKLL